MRPMDPVLTSKPFTGCLEGITRSSDAVHYAPRPHTHERLDAARNAGKLASSALPWSNRECHSQLECHIDETPTFGIWPRTEVHGRRPLG